jgi:hypothetical protein
MTVCCCSNPGCRIYGCQAYGSYQFTPLPIPPTSPAWPLKILTEDYIRRIIREEVARIQSESKDQP